MSNKHNPYRYQFIVKRKDNYNVVKPVFAVKESSCNVLMFLTFDFGKWLWMPADEYVPLDFNE